MDPGGSECLCGPISPKKTWEAGLHLDPATQFPSYTPWLPSLARPKFSTQFLVEEIQHPGQGTEQPYSQNLWSPLERQPYRLLTVPLLFQPLSLCSCCTLHVVSL